MFETHITFSKPTLSTTLKRATTLVGKFNGDIPSTDNCHPFQLLLEIEEAIRVDAKRRPWVSPRPK